MHYPVYLTRLTCLSPVFQLDLLGASLYDYTHPCDHDELRDTLSERDSDEDCQSREHTFFLRHKCTLTSKGRSVNLKSASYKVRCLRCDVIVC